MGFSQNRFQTGKSFGEKKQQTNDNVKIEDLVDIFKFPSNRKYQHFRLVGGVMSYAHWWLPIKTAKKLVNIPKQALSWDPNSEVIDTTVDDPYRDACEKLEPLFPDESREKQNRNKPKLQTYYFINAIVRNEQEEGFKAGKLNAQEKESGYKDFSNQDSFTPVRVLKLPAGLAGRIAKLQELNIHKIDGEKQPVPVSDLEHGCDIAVLFDDDKQGAAKYEVQIRDQSPLTEEEQNYLIYKLDGLLVPEDLATAKAEAKKIVDSHGGTGFSRAKSSDDFEGDDGARKPASRRADVDEDFDSGGAPARRAAPATEERTAPSRSSRSSDDDDFDGGSTQNRGGRKAATDDEEAKPARTVSKDDNPESGSDKREPSAAEKRQQSSGSASKPSMGGASKDSFDL